MTKLEADCLRACKACAQLCEERVRQDESFRGRSQYTGDQIALITCGEVCRVAASSIENRDLWLQEVCAWCSEVCLEFASRPRRLGEWPALEAAGREAASKCRDVASALNKTCP